MKSKVDIARVRRGMRGVYVNGIPLGGTRGRALADAIAAILADGKTALCREYIGVKRYSGFGEQREDHQYGYGPAHGSIVFEIGRNQRQDGSILGADEVYALEALRDAGAVRVRDGYLARIAFAGRFTREYGSRAETIEVNLFGAVLLLEAAEALSAALAGALSALLVEDHAAPVSDDADAAPPMGATP